jgi:hypothetical protein
MPFQLPLLGNPGLPEEMVLAEEASRQYDWGAIHGELEPRFKKAAIEFHARNANPPAQSADDDEPLLFSIEEQPCSSQEDPEEKSLWRTVGDFFKTRNPRGAGRKPLPFLAYLKAFLLAPIFYIEQDCTLIANSLRVNPYYLQLCGFHKPPSARALQDFDQVMREAGLWKEFEKWAFVKNMEVGIIDMEKEHTLNIDPTHLEADSTPGKKIKNCRECPYIKTCDHPLPTDETAGWYQKSKYKGIHAHMISASQLAGSGAPFSFVLLNGKIDERASFEPLLETGKAEHPDFTIKYINADGIFNNAPCRDTVKKLYPEARFCTPVHARRRKDKCDVARGIAKISKHGKVICIEDQPLVFMGRDNRNNAYCFACPVYNPKARKKAAKMKWKTIPTTCGSKNICSPIAEHGRFVRIPCDLLPQLDPVTPQGSYTFWRIYHLRTKIERMFGRLKDRFRMTLYHVRGRIAVESLVSKHFALLHMLAFLTGSYGV